VPPAAGILDPAFHEYVSGFIDSSQAPAAAAAPPVEEDEQEPGSKVCLQRNLPPAGPALEAAAEAVYADVDMVNGLECKLCNMQQKIKKVGGAAAPAVLLVAARVPLGAAAAVDRCCPPQGSSLINYCSLPCLLSLAFQTRTPHCC
jgi:hypothetical protein